MQNHRVCTKLDPYNVKVLIDVVNKSTDTLLFRNPRQRLGMDLAGAAPLVSLQATDVIQALITWARQDSFENVTIAMFAPLQREQLSVGVLLALDFLVDRTMPKTNRLDRATSLVTDIVCLREDEVYGQPGGAKLLEAAIKTLCGTALRHQKNQRTRRGGNGSAGSDFDFSLSFFGGREGEGTGGEGGAPDAEEVLRIPEQEWFVPSRVFEMYVKNHFERVPTLKVRIGPSRLPALQGKSNAWSVFLDQDGDAGDLVAVYGGAIEEQAYAERLRKPDLLLASHIKDVKGKWNGYLLDGIINQRGMLWYVERVLVGSILNDPLGSGSGATVREEAMITGLEGFAFPHARTSEM